MAHLKVDWEARRFNISLRRAWAAPDAYYAYKIDPVLWETTIALGDLQPPP